MAHRIDYSIVGGPSKFDLMISLFDSTRERPRLVEFEISSKGPHFENVQVRIMEVSHKGGSGEDWNFSGIAIPESWPEKAKAYFNAIPRSELKARGYFSTKTRQGAMTIGKE